MGFRSSILAGNTLIRAAIQSQNYSAGVAGWRIAADGTAEFVGLVLRGNGTEVLVVGPATGPQVVVGSDGTSGHIEFPTNRPDADYPATIQSLVQNAGQPDEMSSLVIDGPSMGGASDRFTVTLDSQAEDGSTNATVRVVLNDTTELVLLDPTDLYLYTRVNLAPPASTGTILSVAGAVGQTGLLFQVANDGGLGLLVDADGNTEVSGVLDVGGDTFLGSDVTITGALNMSGDINAGDVQVGGDVFISGVDQGRGLVDFTIITSNAATTTTTEVVAITSGSVDFEDQRAYSVKVRAWVMSSVTGDVVQTRLRKTNAAGQQLFDTFRSGVITGAGSQTSLNYEAIIRNVSGATVNRALAVTYLRAVGTGNVLIGGNATNPSWIRIEDIGPASDYPDVNAIT